MLDPALCDRPVSSWTSFVWDLFDWLVNPWLILGPAIALLVLPWLIRPLPRKRLWSGLGGLILLAYLVLPSPPVVDLANLGLVSRLPADSGKPADAIVVLGRGQELRQSRAEVAADLWRAGRAPRIFVSGRGDGPIIFQLLQAEGVPQTALDDENCSQTTEENAQFTAAILKPQGVKRIILVTDPPHMFRSLRTFQSLGFQVIPHPSPLPPWLASPRRAFLVLREYAGIASYKFKGRFQPRRSLAIVLTPVAA